MQRIFPNNFKITIDGTDYTKHVPFPLKWRNLLDEQLDEGNISLILVAEETFEPFTQVTIQMWNGNTPQKDRILNMYVATDESVEVPAGSGKYNHTLNLIEQTKLLEGIFPRSHGYVNALAYSYIAQVVFPEWSGDRIVDVEAVLKHYNAPLPNLYTPYDKPFPSMNELFSMKMPDWSSEAGNLIILPDKGTIIVTSDNGEELYNTSDLNAKIPMNLALSVTITYKLKDFHYYDTMGTIGNQQFVTDADVNVSYSVGYARDVRTPQKWTIRSVIRRVLDIAIPLRKGEKPRFTLDGDNPLYLGRFDTLEQLQSVPTDSLTYNSQDSNIFYSSSAFVGESYDNGAVYTWQQMSGENTPSWHATTKTTPVLNGQALEFELIDAPEFQFTQSNLREVLQGIGQFIHGEPRLNNNVISYDMYGSRELAQMPSKYGALDLSCSIERYASNIDSNVGNLIDSINYSTGTRVEPFDGGAKSLRTEAVYARVEETNMFIATDRPINSVVSLKWYNPEDNTFHDITPYVFEESDYKQMSSYSETYPYSKGYAIYYSRGNKNVQGLNFKIPNAINTSVFSRYAIVNIIRAVIGNSAWTVPADDYAPLAFRITYQPIVAARVQQSKQNIIDVKEERSIAYNQGQNVIEAHYYGESLKGLIARLGNVDLVLTTAEYGIGTPPKIGTLWIKPNTQEEYYVSSVACEVNSTVTKMTIALTKDFNRYSAYVALDRQKRQWEISERAAYDSFYSYRDYCVIGTGVSNPTDALTDISLIKNILTQEAAYKPLSVMFLQGEDDYGNTLQQVALACQSLAMGNAAVYTASYQDNYSAGVAVVHQTVGNVTGYFTNSVPYSDFFGNFKYLNMNIAETVTGNIKATSLSVPSATGLTASNIRVTTGEAPLLIEKGSTEVLNINYQVDFVTNRREIIVGSALSKNLVKGTQNGHAAKLYLLPDRLNKYATTVDLTGAQEVTYGISELITNSIYINPVQNTTGNNYSAYAFVDGATNELLFGGNRTINNNGYVFTDDAGVGLSLILTHNITSPLAFPKPEQA